MKRQRAGTGMDIVEVNDVNHRTPFSIPFRQTGEGIFVENGNERLSLAGIFEEAQKRYPGRFRGAIVYSEMVFRDNIRRTREIMSHHFGDRYVLFWAVKSAPVRALVEIAAGEGASFDAGSFEELRMAGEFVAGEKIAHTGAGKFDWDLDAIVDHGALSISDNLTELVLLNERARGARTRVRAGIRINPAIKGSTQREISTGTMDCKFGIPDVSDDLLSALKGLDHVDITTLHMHIGSQIADPGDYTAALSSIIAVYRRFVSRGFPIDTIDVGGGYPYPYAEQESAPTGKPCGEAKHAFHNYTRFSFEDYITEIGKTLRKQLGGKTPRIAIEPGRHISAGSAFVLGYVLNAKFYPNGLQWVVSSISVNDLAHKLVVPDTYFDIHLVKGDDGEDRVPTAVCSTLCFSGDILTPAGKVIPMTRSVRRGDILLFRNTGSYCLLGSGNFHNMPRLPVLMIDQRSNLVEIRAQETPYFE